MTVISGQRCYESYGRHFRLGSLAKMLLESSIWHSKTCALRWKIRAMKSNRLLFQLAPSTPRTVETGFGLSHVPSRQEPNVSVERLQTKDGKPARVGQRAYNKHTGRLAQVGLQQQIGMIASLLPTPRTTDANGGRRPNDGKSRIGKNGVRYGLNLADKIAGPTMLPTPRAGKVTDEDEKAWMKRRQDGKVSTPPLGLAIKILLPTKGRTSKVGTSKVGRIRRLSSTGRTSEDNGMKLQPNFVEWMMGYPQNWTDLNSPWPGTGLNA